jgi:hypothetical protein
MAAPATEPLVDAKDEARQAEVRTDIAGALLKIHEDRMFFVKWMIGVGIGIVTLVFAAAGLVIALLR